MAPRKPKADDDASTTSIETVLKPNTTKSKVEKPKSDKPKTTKPRAPKKEKNAADSEEKPEKPVKKAAAKKVVADFEDGGGKSGGKAADAKGEKVKPVTGEEAVQLILAYLKAQNRPYSATEVSANLHGKVTKTNADKLLKEMEQNGQIMGKATKKDGGGQWVFWPIQDASDAASPEELASMETEISALKETNPVLKNTLKSLTNKFNNLKCAPTTSELSSIIFQLQTSLKEKREKLEGFKSGSVKMVTREELQNTEKEWKYWNQKRMLRKNAFLDMEGTVLDGLDGLTKEDLWEKAGLEEDVM